MDILEKLGIKDSTDISMMLCVLCGLRIPSTGPTDAQGRMAPIRSPDAPTVAICDGCFKTLRVPAGFTK